MIPSRTFLLLIGALALAGILPVWLPQVQDIWLAALAGLSFVALLDLFYDRSPGLSLTRSMLASVSLNTWNDISLRIDNTDGRRDYQVQLFDHYPENFRVEGLPADANVETGRTAIVTYRARAIERGLQQFTGCDMRVLGRFGLWWRRRFVPFESDVRVYPNYSTISKLLAYEVDSNLQMAGLRLRRRRGEGIEFHQLRDYREGDTLRSIHWKATARVGRLIAREYQDERDQQIVFLLDTGRRMLAKDADLSHFDHTLNAMLLLSYVALRQGDATGVLTMGPTRKFLPPKKGADTINGILNHVYDIQPQPQEIDYVAAATDLAVRQRRRSLIVMLTNVREEDTDELRMATDLLSRRHLVMVASLRERILDETLNADIRSHNDALSFASTNHYLDARRESHNLLRASGVYVEDCLSDELPAAITNRYLAIKRAGLL